MGTEKQQAALDDLAREWIDEVFGEPTKDELEEMARLRAGKKPENDAASDKNE